MRRSRSTTIRRSSWCASSTDRARAGLSLAIAQFAIGAAAIFARYALTGAGALAVSASRLAIAGAIVLALLIARRERASRDAATERRLVLAGLALAAHFGCWIESLKDTSVAISTLLVTTSPVFTEIARTLRGRRVRALTVTSIALAIAGITVIVSNGSALAATQGRDPVRGAVLALAGAIAIAVYLVLVRESDARYDTLAVVGRTYPVAALALIVAAAFARQAPPAPHDGVAWSGIIAMAIVSQGFGHTALNAAVRTLSATLVAMSTLLEPLVAAALAAWLFHERLGGAAVTGAVLVFAGIALALVDERPEPQTR